MPPRHRPAPRHPTPTTPWPAGAHKPEFQPGGEHWTVLLDPSGQPLCISQAQPS
ncbi:hypothetical protein AB0C93_00420 [Streptomyces sp. NPDC048518]|uniref:hypothetical protein n=1 Tax=Streptomyces sp. NPDC048518 TaxID=3155029 RepID=UPI0033EAA3CD